MSAETATPGLDSMLAALSAPQEAPAPAPVADVAVEAPEADAPAEEAPAQPEEKNTETPQASPEEKNALERARTALRRDGVPVHVIDSLDHAKLLRWGGSRAKVQADTDDAYRQLSELRKEKETQAAKAAEAPKESATTEPAEEPLDFDALGKAISESVGDEALAGRVTGILKSLESRTATRTTELQSQLKQQLEVNQRLSGAILRMEMKSARQELGERFPMLREDAFYEKVQAKMQKLAPSGAYEDVHDLMREAAIIETGSSEQHRSNDATKSRDRRNGLPTIPKSATPATPKSKQESAIAALLELEKKHGLL